MIFKRCLFIFLISIIFMNNAGEIEVHVFFGITDVATRHRFMISRSATVADVKALLGYPKQVEFDGCILPDTMMMEAVLQQEQHSADGSRFYNSIFVNIVPKKRPSAVKDICRLLLSCCKNNEPKICSNGNHSRCLYG